MRVLALCGLIVAVLMLGTCNEPSHPSSETTRSINQALDRISPPIHQAPNSPGAFVLRDKNISAFFKDSGVAISVSRLQPAAPDYPADRIQFGVADRGLFRTSRRPGPVEPLFSPVRYRLGIHWGLVGARAVEPQPQDKQQARINYLVGDRSKWKTGLPGFSRVAYREVYPGVDLVISSRAHGIKYSLYGKPGSDLSRIPLVYSGVGEIRVVEDGQALEIRTALGVLRESGLRCYQVDASGMKREVKARYGSAQAGSSMDEWEYEIQLDDVDSQLPLVIDPVIEWSSFLGGGGDPGIEVHGTAIALDSSNNVYLTGITKESDFPTTSGFSPDHRGAADAYVVKVDASGSSLVWASYLGGSNADEGFSIAVDDAGNAYVCGRTTSTDFPATGSPGPALQGTSDTFVAKINADGASLAWSFYHGGTQWEVCHRIRVDANRDV